MKNPYYPTALGLYFNYLVHGMGVHFDEPEYGLAGDALAD
ncbi:major facilitator superfamily protein [Escherichia coli]|uniref:Major facilitator superfamily protein n=1 Tax=Escherichia coli TaxID=562 RepID=A0A376LNA4_ECOLX|nr:major facilitator superfamily protein [Escherichia coli]